MHALEVKQLVKTYGNGFTALKGIDLSVEAGDFFALLGPNGAGKTSLIGIITTLVTKTSGTVRVFGADQETSLMDAKRHIGVVPQEINLAVFETGERILINAAGYYGIPNPLARIRAEKYLKQLELWDVRHQISRTYSGGMKRRLMIARALMHEPKLLILDEPTAGVDIEIRRSMWAFLKKINAAGTTIILTTHYLEEAEHLCRNIGIINRGQIVINTSIQALLATLKMQTVVLTLDKSLSVAPDIQDFNCRLAKGNTLEVDVLGDQNLNALFEVLSAQGVVVKSMANKVNRLEELFVSLTRKDEDATID